MTSADTGVPAGRSGGGDSERARAERVLSVVQAIDEGYCVSEIVVDEHGVPCDYRFLEVNAAFEQLTGLVDPVGRCARDMVPGLEDHWIETYAQVALDGEPIRFEQGSDAMGRWFDVFALPIAPYGRFALVFRDQTERHAAEMALVESEHRFRTMADQLPMFMWEHDASGAVRWVNQTLCDFAGLTREQMIADGWQSTTHPDDDLSLAVGFLESVDRRTEFHGQARLRRSDGEWRWIETWGRPRYGTAGDYLGHLGTSIDVTDRVESEHAVRSGARFLRRLIDNLFAFVGVLTPDGTLIEANRAPLDAAGISSADVIGRKFWEARWWTVDSRTQQQLRDAIERAAAGEVVRYDVQVRGTGDDLIWIDFQLAPLRDDNGTVTHLVPSGHVISERIETEQRLAAALDAERRTRERVELLQRNATQLAGAITIDEVASALLDELSDSMGLDLTALNVVRGDRLEVIAPSQMPDEAVSRYQDVSVEADLPGPIAIRTNQPVVVSGRELIRERFPDVVDAANQLPAIETIATLPLRAASGRPIGALFLASPKSGWLDANTLDLLTSIAGQTGLALERAQLHRELIEAHQVEHTIALQLQRAMLPDRVVEIPNVHIAARYVAAGDLMAIGGDWYDTFAWSDRHVAVTVGDVVGHDLAAATTMGRLRIGVNALMQHCDSTPSSVLDAYAGYGADLGPAFATATCVVIDAVTGSLSYANAGHPAPLVVMPDGDVRWLAMAGSPPLGVPTTAGHAGQISQLPPGATVVLYSDGLIERRRVPLDIGFARLAASAAQHAAADVDQLADAILADLTDDHIADDVIVVCVRWTPPVDD